MAHKCKAAVTYLIMCPILLVFCFQELSSEPEEVEQLYCIVCEKKFKSAGQLANHERSKAHREAVATLKEMLQDEEAWLLVSAVLGCSL